jgi:hypothetical protein
MQTWQAVGRLDVSLGGPSAAGSLVRCAGGCGGRGWVETEDDEGHLFNDYCPACQGQGQFELPPEPRTLQRLARLDSLPGPMEQYDDEPDGAEARPRRAPRRLTDAA